MSEPDKASAADYRSPKPLHSRRLKTPDGIRQVRFEHEGKTPGNTKAEQQGTFNTNVNKPSPDSFPGIGTRPGGQLHWYTSANPTQSVNCQPHTLGSGFAQPQQQGYFNASTSSFPFPSHNRPPLGSFHDTTSGVTYIGLQPQPAVQVNNMAADYQNAAPPPSGVHFQPPVPDTTFGPIPHVYVPRFDGGLMVPGVQQPQAPQPCVQGGYVVTQQPVYLQQPVMAPQPVMMQQQPAIAPQPQMVQGMPAVGLGGGAAATMMSGGIPVFAGNNGHVPEVSGLGRTTGEEQLRQIQFAHAHRLYEPQDFKPADDDPSRFYFVREVDGNWTQRNRFTIDSMGDCRWYVTDEGWFYAVRLPD